MEKLRIRTAYDTDESVGLDFSGEDAVSQTIQSERDECDVNYLVAQYQEHGILPQVDGAFYGDIVGAPEFREALDIVNDAQDAFNALPAKVRKEFENDPGQFLAAFDDPERADDLIRLGLRTAPPEPAPQVPIQETAKAAPTPSKDGSKLPSE